MWPVPLGMVIKSQIVLSSNPCSATLCKLLNFLKPHAPHLYTRDTMGPTSEGFFGGGLADQV